MRVAILFARHGATKYPGAELRLKQIYDSQLAGVETFTLIVDNALEPDFSEQIDSATALIGGDNSSWEFSAWDKGIDFFGATLWSYDLVHLVTSAFDSLYTSYLDLFSERMLAGIASRPVCLGHIDFYNEPVQVLSFRSQHWIRSSFLFSPPTELKIMGSLVSVHATVDSTTPFDPGTPLSANYQRYILDWLTGSDIGQGTTWHTTLSLAPETLPYVQSKARAILNEHLLSIRLRAQATRLIDTTWFASHLDSSDSKAIDWLTSWQEQMGSRLGAGSATSGADELARLSR